MHRLEIYRYVILSELIETEQRSRHKSELLNAISNLPQICLKYIKKDSLFCNCLNFQVDFQLS